MDDKKKSVLIIGFNTRPLAYSLNKAGYDVYVVDFFGDLDLYPYVKDYIIIRKELNARYNSIRNNYQQFLAHFTIDLLDKYPDIENFIIASGMDDHLEERKYILDEIKKRKHLTKSLNNNINVVKNARDIFKVYHTLQKMGYKVPITYELKKLEEFEKFLSYPLILKKKKSSGGINVYKIKNREHLAFLIKKLEIKDYNYSKWLIQEYIEGIPVSCTTISNGTETRVISINRQIIGLENVNPLGQFVYCGNVVPGNLLKSENKLISEISIFMANKLRLKGINGFDFVLKNHFPYLMEINPRIPGSIQASEASMNINLLNLHILSFNQEKWNEIIDIINDTVCKKYATKLIYFAPKEIPIVKLKKINNLKFIQDKSEPIKNIVKREPVCSILFSAKSFSESFFGALKIANEITKIIS
ncbi:MAG: ATP-grasp domain-containing protein [Candidatus Hermodarchaeota archaeon]